MALTLDNNLKDHMRIDNSLDDDLIESYQMAAKQTLINAIGGTIDDSFYQNNQLFDLSVKMLTDHYYQERSATVVDNQNDISYGVQSIILQLKPSFKQWSRDHENC